MSVMNMPATGRFEKVDINKLIPYARNARTHSREQIVKLRSSLREFGFINPVIVDKDLNIIAGHGRVMAAKEEGLPEIPCVFAEHLTGAQKKAYILADNRLAEDAGWDNELLSLEFGDLKNLGFDLELTGFSADELEKMIWQDVKAGAEDDGFDVDKAAGEPPFVMRGDLWRLGNHRLLCGDSTDAADVAKLLDGKKMNLVLTDPPYNVNYESKGKKIQNDNMSDEEFHRFLLSAFTQAEAAMAADASIYVFYADSKGLVFRQAFDGAGFRLASNCVWVKDNFTFGRSDYKWGHEVCLYGWKKSGKHNWHGDMKQSTIWNCPKPKKNDGHPTMKPIPLLAIPLGNSTQTNGLVFDPFAGSFSTGVCCEQLRRICYGMELDPVYASVCVKRMMETLGGPDRITVERDGKILTYREVAGDG